MAAWWKALSAKVRGLLVLGALLITVVVLGTLLPFLVSSDSAEAGTSDRASSNRSARERSSLRVRMAAEEEEWNRRWARMEEETRLRAQALEGQREDPPPTPKRARQVRRWVWESPVETRARLWNIPESETEESVVVGLLRVCTAEAEGHPEDCIGIWQVLNNIRSRDCNRQFYQKITECDEGGETLLSVMRRAQRFALGVAKARSRRTEWISKLDPGCDPPDNYPESARIWDQRHRHHCQETVELAKRLVRGEGQQTITSVAVITWGGRCEDSTGACDDRLACSRGLARVPGLETANAFWCRPGGRGCATDIDPVCRQLGYPSVLPPDAPTEGSAVGALMIQADARGSDENS